MSEDRILKREPLFQGRVVDVAVETVELPNGRRVELEVIRHPGGAATVALDEQERVCLLRQFRHAGGGWLWELPAGKIDPGEEPLATARRELEEEAGVRALDQTGVEMEALTAAAVAALTIYDMCKSHDRDMVVSEIQLVEKSGGKSGAYKRDAHP